MCSVSCESFELPFFVRIWKLILIPFFQLLLHFNNLLLSFNRYRKRLIRRGLAFFQRQFEIFEQSIIVDVLDMRGTYFFSSMFPSNLGATNIPKIRVFSLSQHRLSKRRTSWRVRSNKVMKRPIRLRCWKGITGWADRSLLILIRIFGSSTSRQAFLLVWILPGMPWFWRRRRLGCMVSSGATRSNRRSNRGRASSSHGKLKKRNAKTKSLVKCETTEKKSEV